MPEFVAIGDVLVKPERIVGARAVPEGSNAKGKGSDNCLRLKLQDPDETLEVFPLDDDSIVGLFHQVHHMLNGGEEPVPVADAAADAETEAPPDAEEDGDNAEIEEEDGDF